MSDGGQNDGSNRPKVIPAKRYFTIGEVSDLCAVKPHVLRYWEQEFEQLRPVKRRGNRRYYQHHELIFVRRIRELMYVEGLTIGGVKKRLDNLKLVDTSAADIRPEPRQNVIERLVANFGSEPHVFQPIPAKRYFTIGEVSDLCAVKPHVLRYWEQEFEQLRPVKRRGNRRYYQHHELLLVRRIRELLVEEGFTIAGVRSRFNEQSIEPNSLSYPFHVELIGVGQALSEYLQKDPLLVHRLTPEEFEEFVCERLFAMGFEPRQVGNTNRKDGGVDVVFWPRLQQAFPFLGAAQIKHHRDPSVKEGPATVREFAGVMAGHPFHAGLIVTNTTFTPDAEWFAREHANLMKLRGLNDIRRWLLNNFSDEAEWREIPSSIELCPGVVVRIR